MSRYVLMTGADMRILAAARAYGLDFVPLAIEPYHLVVAPAAIGVTPARAAVVVRRNEPAPDAVLSYSHLLVMLAIGESRPL